MLAGVWVLGTGMAAGWYGRSLWEDHELARRQAPGLFELRSPSHRFARPLVECDLRRSSPEVRVLQPFHDLVDQEVSALKDSGKAAEVAVYFRQLYDGLWFATNENGQFTPASLHKVPLMMTVLKQGERTPGFLDRTVVVQLEQDMERIQNVKPSQSLETGKAYSIRELVRRMIIYSDNNAFQVLSREVDERLLTEVYGALGVGLDDSVRASDLRSVAAFAGFFRVLFNGTYLSWDTSDQALALLVQTEFRQGLVAGVPANVPVAHKFAEHVTGDVVEFHDCGVVYFPGRPYLLCVMTSGKSLQTQVSVVASLSRLVYDNVASQSGDGPRASKDPAR